MNLTDYISGEKAEELKLRYYKGEPVQNLLIEYDIPVTASKLVNLFPPKVLNLLCRHCGKNMVQKYPSRTAIKSMWNDSTKLPFCPCCKHIYIEEVTSKPNQKCLCQECKHEYKQALEDIHSEERHAADEYIYNRFVDNRELNSIGQTERLFLAALFRGAGDENCASIIGGRLYSHVLSDKGRMIQIAPTNEFIKDTMLMGLWNNKILSLSFETDVSGFAFTREEENLTVEGVYLDKCIWDHNIYLINNEQILSPGKIINVEECFNLWRLIAKAEIIKYLTQQRNDVNLDAPVGSKTHSLISWLLDRYSASQAYNFIWRGIRDTIYIKEKNGLSRKHAANIVIPSIQRRAERCYNEGVVIEGYNRTEPLSIIAELLYDNVLGIGEAAFTTCPNLETIENLVSVQEETESSNEPKL